MNVSKNSINIGKKVKITFVKDRPGHDVRYALDSNKIKKNYNGILKQVLKKVSS
jgi:dTDP-glucose 4,6-dehydratase